MENNLRLKKSQNLKKILRYTGTIITIALLFYLILKQDWYKIEATFHELPILVIIFVWFLFFIRIIINSLRWFIVLKIYHIEMPFWESMKLFYLGMFISNFLPSTIGGDGFRFLALLRYSDNKTTALSSIISDRLINVISTLCLLPISAYVFFNPFMKALNIRVFNFLGIVGLSEKVHGWRKSLKRMVQQFLDLFKSPRLLGASFIVAWIAQLSYIYGIWLLARNLGLQIDYLTVIGITVVSYTVTLLPISINGYGVREITITSLYSLLGYPMEAAISLAVISRLVYMTTTLPGAMFLPENIAYISKYKT